jgi:hypothetical protein
MVTLRASSLDATLGTGRGRPLLKGAPVNRMGRLLARRQEILGIELKAVAGCL